MMNHEKDNVTVDWPEIIIIFNSLLRNIAAIRLQLDDDDLDEEVQYNLDEELNDYTMLLQRLKIRYEELSIKGELSSRLKTLLQEFN